MPKSQARDNSAEDPRQNPTNAPRHGLSRLRLTVCRSIHSNTEVCVKFLWSVSFLACSFLVVGGITVATRSLAESPSMPIQDASSASSTAPNLSGNWQMSWAGPNGNQRQVSMQLKQNGKKLSGTFEGPRGSVSVKGTCDGNQVSFTVKLPRRQASFSGNVDGDKMSGTTEQGASWTATRQQ